ncbi:MAG: protein phosphatase 2C domain-containing protein [Firmicutes bacterium]|nr:protein phosphatase 2C domain-containing protein [Bacillota bacterium]MCL1953310.1 protein phosphatase 2C domain-containing protein [Bacillota bacterium]
MKMSIASICKQGGRQYNQDFVASSINNYCACLVVCDGLGSYVGSEVASSLCANRILQSFSSVKKDKATPFVDKTKVHDYIFDAHNYVVNYKEDKPKLISSCTTVATLFTNYNTTILAHIGDSRVYYFSDGKLQMQTLDHSMAQAAVERGEIKLSEVRTHKDQNKLTRVLGSDYFAEPDCQVLDKPLQSGDWFLICTDGWWEYVFEEEMEGILRISKSPEDAISRMEKRLIKRAPYNNDNFTAIVAQVV